MDLTQEEAEDRNVGSLTGGADMGFNWKTPGALIFLFQYLFEPKD